MQVDEVPFAQLLSHVTDNRGRTCPTTSSGIPLIATNCIDNTSLYPSYDKVRFVSRETYDTWFRGHPLPGDIIFVNKGTPGRVALVPDPVDFCIAQDMVAVRADPRRVYSKYLFAALRSTIVQDRVEQLHVGTLIPHLKKSDFARLTIPLPPTKQQQLIGDTYFTLCRKIDLNRRVSETLESMVRALFKSWFVDFDPVRAKAQGRETGLPKEIAEVLPDRFDDSELGEVPSGWRVGRFGDVVQLLRDPENPQATPDATYQHYSIPAFDESRSPTSERGASIKSQKSRVRAGAVLLSKLNPEIERVWLVDVQSTDRAVCSTEFLVLHARSAFTRAFVYCLARSRSFRRLIEGLVTGTSNSHQRAQAQAILDLPVVIPPARLVGHFDNIAEVLLVRTLACRNESRTLATLRDSLLPSLLAGKKRMADGDINRGIA